MADSRPKLSSPGGQLRIVAPEEALSDDGAILRRLGLTEIFRLIAGRSFEFSTAAARIAQLGRKASTTLSLAELISAEELYLRDDALSLRLFGSTHGGGGENPIPPPPVPPVDTHWVIFRVVDDVTSMPIDGVKLLITIPENPERPYVTRSGVVEIHDIRPGSCDVRCERAGARLPTTLAFVAMGESPTSPAPTATPSGAAASASAAPGSPDATSPPSAGGPAGIQGDRVLEVEKHKVQTGESIDSLARGAGMTWQDLSLFNWGTSVPTEINEHLRDEVGCTRKTSDGHNYIFTSEDDPGIVFIPRAWERRGLPTDQVHTVRVKKPGLERERFIFSM